MLIFSHRNHSLRPSTLLSLSKIKLICKLSLAPMALLIPPPTFIKLYNLLNYSRATAAKVSVPTVIAGVCSSADIRYIYLYLFLGAKICILAGGNEDTPLNALGMVHPA